MLELKNICKTFGKDNSKVEALKDISLCIKAGEMVAIMGSSGSGKSTLLNIIGTLENYTKGTYLIDGKDVSELKTKQLARLRNKKFGFIVQNFALVKDFTVYENVEIPLVYGKKKQRKEKIINILKSLGIDDKEKFKPKQLSGGQCQRVAIARALVNDADIILADEPTGALDKNNGKEVIEILKKLNKKGKTIIIVTHDIDIANECERIIKIEDGKLENSKIIKTL